MRKLIRAVKLSRLKNGPICRKYYDMWQKDLLKTLTHCSQLNFVTRTTTNSRNIITDAKPSIRTHVLMSFFDSPLSQSARLLFSLPIRENGLNIEEPIEYETEHAASLTAWAPLEEEDRENAHLNQECITHDQRTASLNIVRACKKNLMKSLQTAQRLVIEITSEKEASNWLNALALKYFCIKLTKSKIIDGLCLRYNFQAKNAH